MLWCLRILGGFWCCSFLQSVFIYFCSRFRPFYLVLTDLYCAKGQLSSLDDSVSVSMLNVFVRVSFIKWDTVIFYVFCFFLLFFFHIMMRIRVSVENRHHFSPNLLNLNIVLRIFVYATGTFKYMHAIDSDKRPAKKKGKANAHRCAHCPGGWWK